MCTACKKKIEEVWSELTPGRIFRTPDSFRGINFSLNYIGQDYVRIAPQNIRISKDSFIAALHYLNANGHDINNPCEIRANNDPEMAGPLCRIARRENNNVRCVNNILPIISGYGIVGIDGGRPNKVWLL